MTGEKKYFYTSKYFHLLVCVALAGLTALVLLPFGQSNAQSGHDIKYHLGVIRSLSAAWDSGDFFSKVMELIGGDYGYGTGLFYSTLPAGICVFFMKTLGLSVMGALYLEFFLLFFGGAAATYFFLGRVLRNHALAAIGATVYLFYPYFLWDLYVRFAFTEIFLMFAIPLIVWGVYELLYRKNPRAFLPLFIFGYALAILCHLTMTVYLTLLLLVWLFVDCKRVFKGKNLLYFAIATAVVLLITANFYLPMTVNYGVTATDSMSKTPAQMEANTKKYFTEKVLMWDYKFSLVLSVAYALWYLFLASGKRTAGKTAILVCSALILLLFTHYFPWQYMPNFLRMIQYTFRVLLLGGVLAPLQLCIPINETFFVANEKEKGAQNSFTTDSIRKKQEGHSSFSLTRVISAALLFIVLSCCGTLASLHNNTMYSAYDKALTRSSVAMDELTGRSEFEALGAGKHGDYFPQNCQWEYVANRVEGELISQTNMEIAEVADYRALKQVSFVVKATENGYAVLDVPYENFDGVQIYRFRTTYSNKRLEITANSYENGDKVRLTTVDDGNESKIILSYKNAPKFEEYLCEKAFGVLVLEGDVTVSNLNKERAGSYSLDVSAGKNGGVLELPSYYYKGYKLTLITADGKRIFLSPEQGRNGFVEVKIAQSGRLCVEFSAPYLTLSQGLTAVGVILLGGVFAWCVFYEKEKNVGTEKASKTAKK